MIRSSFASFSAARLGLMASQNGLDISTQNITNVKTMGYTRQRLTQLSLSAGSPGLYNQIPDAHIGYGVNVTGTTQYRDPFMDTRYRFEMANLSTSDKKFSILKELESRLDEIGSGKEALAAQLSELHTGLQNLQANPGDVTADNQIRAACQSIAEHLNLYSSQLDDVRNQTVTGTEKDVSNVNQLLSQIHELNGSIKNSQANGFPALELQDQRNLLLDSLATYGKINVEYTSTFSPSGAEVQSMTVTMATEGGSVQLLHDSDPPASFEMVTNADGSVGINVTPSDGSPTINNAAFTAGAFKSSLSMLNSSGTFDGSTTNGIGYYQKMLDEFSQTFAETLNSLNNWGVAGDTAQNLFDTNPPGGVVTAGNITLSEGWLTGTVHINCGASDGAPDGDTTNVLNMINAITGPQTFTRADGTPVFTGSFQECLENFRNVLNTDTKATESTTNNYLSLVKDAGNARDSVSGVNIDEETTNIMMYNKAFSASARLITTLDEMLSTVIGMGAR